ncbi:GCN5-related N-acetyltransferase [Fibrella aestuarina BUZ 2]|uniref:GCN5-related N-acetyltransferase n=1 Tax=Fibrella aestuarina BUZ 2 TaxID=1166018 RepID=I0K1N5_9BACT|nr:GNAT family N-acetyltransferase [Fibrella aestuarina]CCG98038.1 GCN5-related N-acetyltransferase [Fibrella aestuarina BUZ 2]
MTLLRTTSDHTDFQRLVLALDTYLTGVNGSDDAYYRQFNTIDALRYVVVAYVNDVPVGCGAFKPFDQQATEIKRMFVDPAHRGQGIAQAILAELEGWSHEEGYTACVLETSVKLPGAVQLYTKWGYERTPNYGQYVGMPDSICFRKSL